MIDSLEARKRMETMQSATPRITQGTKDILHLTVITNKVNIIYKEHSHPLT